MIVANDLFHRHIHVLTNASRISAPVFIDNREFVAVAEVDELLSVARKVQVDAAMCVVVVRLGRAIGIRESEPPRIIAEGA